MGRIRVLHTADARATVVSARVLRPRVRVYYVAESSRRMATAEAVSAGRSHRRRLANLRSHFCSTCCSRQQATGDDSDAGAECVSVVDRVALHNFALGVPTICSR